MRRVQDEDERAEGVRHRDHALIFFGRQQAELEHFASQKALDSVALAYWVGKLWVSITREWDGDSVSHLPVAGDLLETGKGRSGASKKKSGHGTHDGGSSRDHEDGKAEPGKTAKGKISRLDKQAVYAARHRAKQLGEPLPPLPRWDGKSNWSKNPMERMESSIKRLRKRSDPMAEKMLKSLLKKRRLLKAGKA